jgi:S1-C subfamily serine protease
VVLAFLCGVGVAVALNARGSRPEAAPAEAPPPPGAELAAAAEPAPVTDPARRTPVVEAVAKVAPSVVSISTESPVSGTFGVRRAGGVSSEAGSGVVIDARGFILTNAHVVEQAARLTVSFADGTSLRAQVAGLTPELDLAVLRVESQTTLTPAPIGLSADLLLGEPVIAIGNPFGLGHTVTTGVISALSRPLETNTRVYQDFIQTDASINPGNSGGPLLNAKGELIGINTAIRANAEGIGFAIPVDRAMKVARDLMDLGAVQIPWLGVSIEDVHLQIGRRMVVLPRVVEVFPGTGGAAAGLQPGDLLLSAGEKALQGRGDLNAWLATRPAAEAVPLSVRRAEQSLPITVAPTAVTPAQVDAILGGKVGLRVEDRAGAVVITAILPQSPLAGSPFRPGDRIALIDGTPVTSTEVLRARLTEARSAHKREVTLTIARGDHGLAVRLLI